MSNKSDLLIDFDSEMSNAPSSTTSASKPSDDGEEELLVKCVNCDQSLPMSQISSHSKTCTSTSSSKSSSSKPTSDSSRALSVSQDEKSSGAASSSSSSAASSSSNGSSSSGSAAPRQVADESSSLGLNLSTPSKMSSNLLSNMAGAITDFVSGKQKGEPEPDMPDVSLNNPALQRDYTRTTRIAFVIDEPREGGGRFSGYVSYRVNWRTEMKGFGGAKCYYVRRKYSDFEWFHRHLTRLYPHCVIPPLASPQGFMQKEFDIPFRERRMRLMQRYLNRIGNHPILAESELLAMFLLKGKKESWAKTMVDLDEEEKRERAGPARNSKPYSGDAPAMSPADEEANKAAKDMRNELQLLVTGFRELHKQLEANVTTLTTQQQQNALVSAQIQKFSQIDALRRPVCNIDTSPMVNALSAFNAAFTAIDELKNQAINIESETMWEVVRDWTYYLRAADEYLTRFFACRANCAYSLSAYQARAKLVEKPGAADPKAAAAPVTTDEATDVYLKTLEETKNYDQGKYEAFLKTFEKETVRWEVYKQREIIHWTNFYAKQQIASLQASIEAWDNFLQKNAFRANK